MSPPTVAEHFFNFPKLKVRSPPISHCGLPDLRKWGRRKGFELWTLSTSLLIFPVQTISDTFCWTSYECLPEETVWKCGSLSLIWHSITSAFLCGCQNKHLFSGITGLYPLAAWSYCTSREYSSPHRERAWNWDTVSEYTCAVLDNGYPNRCYKSWFTTYCIYCKGLFCLFLKGTTTMWRAELLIFTKNFQLDLQGLLSCTVPGHTLVGALVSEFDLLDPEGRRVGPNRKPIMKPSYLRPRLSLDHTWQSHCLANQGFQEGGRRLNPGLSWGQKQTS